MAVKILEHGDRYGKIQLKCSCCGCKIECDRTDLWLNNAMIFGIRCPECETWLSESDGTRIEEEQKVTV